MSVILVGGRGKTQVNKNAKSLSVTVSCCKLTAGHHDHRSSMKQPNTLPNLCCAIKDGAAETSCETLLCKADVPPLHLCITKYNALKTRVVEWRTVMFATEQGLLTAKLPKPCSAVAVCAHQCSQFGLAAQYSEPLVTVGWVQVITRPWFLPCAPFNHPLCQPEGIVHSSCVLLGKHHGRGYAVGCVAGCWQHSGSTVQRVLGTGVLTLCCFGKNNCREDSWGVSCQSYIRELSYSFLAAFLSL